MNAHSWVSEEPYNPEIAICRQSGDMIIVLKKELDRVADMAGKAIDVAETATATAKALNQLEVLTVLREGRIDVASLEPLLFSERSELKGAVVEAVVRVLKHVDVIDSFLHTPIPSDVAAHCERLAATTPQQRVNGQARQLLTAVFTAMAFDETLPTSRYQWGSKNDDGMIGIFQLSRTNVRNLAERDSTLSPTLLPTDPAMERKFNVAYFNDLWASSVKQAPLPPQFEKVQDPSLKNILKMMASHRGGPFWHTNPDPIPRGIMVDVAERMGMVLAWRLEHE